jgi:hypothetical protein
MVFIPLDRRSAGANRIKRSREHQPADRAALTSDEETLTGVARLHTEDQSGHVSLEDLLGDHRLPGLETAGEVLDPKPCWLSRRQAT